MVNIFIAAIRPFKSKIGCFNRMILNTACHLQVNPSRNLKEEIVALFLEGVWTHAIEGIYTNALYEILAAALYLLEKDHCGA